MARSQVARIDAFNALAEDILSDVNTSTTILMGHTRWKTRGDQQNTANNHPIRAGNVIGTHNAYRQR